jgi:hypothetical protein
VPVGSQAEEPKPSLDELFPRKVRCTKILVSEVFNISCTLADSCWKLLTVRNLLFWFKQRATHFSSVSPVRYRPGQLALSIGCQSQQPSQIVILGACGKNTLASFHPGKPFWMINKQVLDEVQI